MGRRPLCLVCLLLMMCMCLMDWMGVPLIKGNPLSEPVQAWIADHPKAVICGEIQRCQETEYSQSIYLKQVFLMYQSEKIPIENVRVFLKENKKVPEGASVLVSGKLKEVEEPRNPGEFDAKQYYGCQHIYYFMKEAVIEKITADGSGYMQFLADIRNVFSDILRKTSGSDSPVFEAMLLGQKDDLDEELKMRYQTAGIIHILAISGMHVSYLGMGFFMLLKYTGLGNISAGFLSVFIMLQYGMMTGGSVSAMRAVCMFGLAIGARILGRSYDMLTVLSLSAVLLLLDSPSYLYNSSFQLSFGAVMGIAVTAPVLQELVGAKGKLVNNLLSSLAVQITTLPFVLLAYGEVSVVGVFLNLLILPTVGSILLSGAACCAVGLVWIDGAKIAVMPGRILLALYQWLCEAASGLPFCSWIGGSPEVWQIAGYYALLAAGFGFSWWMKFKNQQEGMCFRQHKKGEKTTAQEKMKRVENRIWMKHMWCVIAVVTLFPGIGILGYHPAKELKITCLDVGQGDGIVVEAPDDHHILIDCGSSNKRNVGQYQLLPYLRNQGISRLDAILVSHTDGDHVSGIAELLELKKKKLISIDIDRIVLPGWEEKPEEFAELSELAEDAGIDVILGNCGDVLKLGEVCMRVLSPDAGASGRNVNEDAMVILLEYLGFQGLFTGDIGMETEDILLERFEDVDFLKVAHHGSRYSTGERFLEVTKPEVAMISCSDSNTYGHPSPETIERLEDYGCQVEYTMTSGAVTVVTDGERMTVERWLEDS